MKWKCIILFLIREEKQIEENIVNNENISIKEKLIYIENELNEKKNSFKKEMKKEEIIFAISLKSKKVSNNWSIIEENLGRTLRSILNNTQKNFRIIIAGHEKPSINELKNKKVEWISAQFPPPVNSKGFTNDKMKKRKLIGVYLRKGGFSGYIMPLDADDLIHFRFVEYINSEPFYEAFIINQGYLSNFYLNEFWLVDKFYKYCGSCSVIYFSNSMLPKSPRINSKFFSRLTLSRHPKIISHLRQCKVNYKMINLPVVFRCFGHGENNMLFKKTLNLSVSAKDYRTQGEEIEKWIYDYFKC
ncbi:glycosyltransferase family A protein [Sutcliffiella halmapala]|uniref:glycosyltransferase family A protein n=1 Tax=Sutcliffiella halmapala TaxID=79882 RepID=UPI000995B33C|nr:glycosyltransferase family A protein [Sutcliffiella halmapala]